MAIRVPIFLPLPLSPRQAIQSGHIHRTSHNDNGRNPPQFAKTPLLLLDTHFTVRSCPLHHTQLQMVAVQFKSMPNNKSQYQISVFARKVSLAAYLYSLLLPSYTWFQEQGTEGSDKMTPVSISYFFPRQRKRFKEKAKRFGMIPHDILFLNFCDMMDDIIMYYPFCHLLTLLRAYLLPLVITRHGSSHITVSWRRDLRLPSNSSSF